jgi:hypothetical protein
MDSIMHRGKRFQVQNLGNQHRYLIFEDGYTSGWYLLGANSVEKMARNYIDKVIYKGKES